jgi:type III secretory pathway component EscV/tetratricopeptide (TPR) repeat protein
MSESARIGELLKASRAAAERAHLDAGVVDPALDAMGAKTIETVAHLWSAFNEQVAEAETPAAKRQLNELRSLFREELIGAEIARIESAFRQSPDAGWIAWLSALAEAVSLFRVPVGIRLCKHPFAFPESKRQTVESSADLIHYMDQDRWPEAYEQVEFLSEQDFLPALTRARLLLILAQIQMRIFDKRELAKELIDAAERLAPRDGTVLSTLAEYWLAEKDAAAKAKSYYQRALELAPGTPDGYIGMGDQCERDNQLESAEEWYRKAMAAAPGLNAGCVKLLKLYSGMQFFAARESELRPLMERAIAAEPEAEYQMYVELGNAYARNQRFEQAHEWFEKAIALNETTPGGHIAIAQCYERQLRNEEAETAYQKAIAVAPSCYDGYWGLTWLYEQEERWADALEWYQKTPQHRKEWASLVRAKIGEMHSRLGNLTEAEDILKRELRADGNNSAAKDYLEKVAEDYYRVRGEKDAAVRLYGEIFEILGDSYQGSYHSLLGNLYYSVGDYERATAEYRQATVYGPTNAVFCRNLSAAYEQLGDFERAEEELKRARKIDHDEAKFNKEMARLLNSQGNRYFTRGDFHAAVQSYTRAIEFNPNDAMLSSNLGDAWEQLKEPGKTLEHLDKAIEAYRRAHSLKSHEGYANTIKRLGRKKEFVARYGEKALDWAHVVTPLAVEIAGDLIPFTAGSAEGDLSETVSRQVFDMRARIKNRFGVAIPGVRFRGNETALPSGTYILMLMDIPLISGSIQLDQRFCPGSQGALASIGVTGERATNPLTRDDGFWIGRDDWRKVEAAGIELWDVFEYVVRDLEAFVQRNLVALLGHQEIAEDLASKSSKSLEEMRASPGKLTALTTVCKALVAEQAPIQPFAETCKEFDRLYSEGIGLPGIVESIRASPLLRPRLRGNDRQHTILPFGPRLEAEFRNAIHRTGAHAVLAMEHERCQLALSAVRAAISPGRAVSIFVDDPDLRPFVRALTELEFPNVPVLSRRELQAGLETAGPIELDEEEPAPAEPAAAVPGQTDVPGGTSDGGRVDQLPESSQMAITVFTQHALTEQSSADDQPIAANFSLMRDALFLELGLILPEVHFEFDSTLEANQFRFKINDRALAPTAGLERDEFLVNDTVDRLALLGIKGRKAVNPASGIESSIVRADETAPETCRESGLTVWGPLGFLVLSLASAIREKAASFQTVSVTGYILDSLRKPFPELIEAALKRFSVEEIRLVLCDLLDEEISIRDMRSVLESMLAINGTTDADSSGHIVLAPYAEQLCPDSQNRGIGNLTPADYSNFVRTSLKSYISHKYSRGTHSLNVRQLDPVIERRIGEVAAHPLTDEERARLKRAVEREIELPATATQTPVLLTTMEVRRTLRKLIEGDFPQLAVLSYQELSADMNIHPGARISWS